MKYKITRRQFLSTCCLGALGSAAYMRCLEPGWLQVGRHTATVDPAARPVRILHLSDIHASRVVTLAQINQAVTLGLSLKPDLVCLTGDFITTKYDQFHEFGRILKRLSDAAPAFACLGNHDGGRWIGKVGYPDISVIASMLRAANITLLHNTTTVLTVNNRPLQLVGVGDIWAEDMDARKAFTGVEKLPGRTSVLLSHNPDSKSALRDYPWDLMLCGHTHGGQLWIPLFGAPFAPVQDKRFIKGLRRWRDRWIHVTKGVGNLHGMRFNCPPEVSLVTLA